MKQSSQNAVTQSLTCRSQIWLSSQLAVLYIPGAQLESARRQKLLLGLSAQEMFSQPLKGTYLCKWLLCSIPSSCPHLLSLLFSDSSQVFPWLWVFYFSTFLQLLQLYKLLAILARLSAVLARNLPCLCTGDIKRANTCSRQMSTPPELSEHPLVMVHMVLLCKQWFSCLCYQIVSSSRVGNLFLVISIL